MQDGKGGNEETTVIDGEQTTTTDNESYYAQIGLGGSQQTSTPEGQETTAVETDMPEGEEETRTEDNTEGTTDENTEDSDESFPIELKIKDKEPEIYDFNDEEDRAKIIEYAQKGRFLEVEQHQILEKEKQLDTEKRSVEQMQEKVSFERLKMYRDGKLSMTDLQDLPYEEFIGASATDTDEGSKEKDIELWNKTNAERRKERELIRQYSETSIKNIQDFDNIVDKFQKAHPEVTDMKQWLKDNLVPFYQAILSDSYYPLPEYTLEMIHYFKNKGTIEKNIRKEQALKKPIKKILPGGSVQSKNKSNNSDYFRQFGFDH